MSVSVLESFALNETHRELPPGSRLMLDSGGFSAWSMGITVTVPDLVAWYAQTPADLYAALDVLYDPEASRRNALVMRERLGFEVIPAVHAGTDPAEVDRLAADGFTTLALGGLVNKQNSRPNADAWAHACLDRAAAHQMRVHGFGLLPSGPARLPLLLRFTSVDSSTWLGSRYANDTRLWDGRAYRSFSWNRDRMAASAVLRRWPGDWTAAMLRHRKNDTGPNDPEGLRQIHLAGAASALAFGEYLMARGGPRVYLASYLHNVTPQDDYLVASLLDTIGPSRSETA